MKSTIHEHKNQIKMKVSKKTITLLAACLLTIAGTQCANAQKAGEKVYGFGYAYSTNYKVKIFYVSNIVEGIQDSDTYLPATGVDLQNQWHDYFRANVDHYSSYHIDWSGFIGKSVSSYNQIDEKRNEMIGEYRQNGYEIRKLNGFHYNKSKYDD